MKDLKKLIEKRNDLLNEMDSLVDKAGEETRALSEEEAARFEAAKAEVSGIDATIKADEERRAMDRAQRGDERQDDAKDAEDAEERAFADFVMGVSTGAARR